MSENISVRCLACLVQTDLPDLHPMVMHVKGVFAQIQRSVFLHV